MFYSLDANTEERPPTLFKLVCAGQDQKVVGVHALGRGVDEMMQLASVLLNMGATK